MAEIAAPGLTIDVVGGLLPAMASLLKKVRSAVRDLTATKEERELFSLMEYAAARHGDGLLAADSVDDLDCRMDELLADPDMSHLNALLARAVLPIVRRQPVSAEGFADAVTDVLGAAQSRTIEAATPLLDAWLRTQHALIMSMPEEAIDQAVTFVGRAHEYLASPELPVEAAEALASRLRAEFCLLAIASAIVRNVALEPWLARALTERLIEGARGILRLLASIPGMSVPEAIVPLSERLDLAAIEHRHRLARATASKTFEAARRARGA